MLPPRGSDDVRPATTSAVSTAPEVPQLWREDESQANPWTTIRTGRESSGIVRPSGNVSDTPVFFPGRPTRVSPSGKKPGASDTFPLGLSNPDASPPVRTGLRGSAGHPPALHHWRTSGPVTT